MAVLIIIILLIILLAVWIVSTQRKLVVMDEKMIHTSGLIYNDSVTKLNRTVRMIPASLIAGILGFRQREYLEMSPF